MRMPRIFAVLAFLASPVCGEEVIRTPSGLAAACQENRRDIPFEVNGIVAIPPTIPQGLFTLLSDNKLITLVDMRTNRNASASGDCRIGGRVIVRGRAEPYFSLHKTTANCYDLQILESGILPDIASMSVRDFLAGHPVPKPIVALRGTLQDVFPDDLN